MSQELRAFAKLSDSKTVESQAGVRRTVLTYSGEVMLVHFLLEKGAVIPLHNHRAVQAGYVVRGRVRMLTREGGSFLAGPGDSYLFQSDEPHGAQVLEQAEVIDSFSPMRPEYVGP